MFSRLVSNKIRHLCTQSSNSMKSPSLHVSTSTRGKDGVITGAALIRRHDGSVVHVEYFQLDTSDIQHADLLALKRGVEILRDKKLVGAMTYCSNKKVVEMVRGTAPEGEEEEEEEEDMDVF